VQCIKITVCSVFCTWKKEGPG